MTRRLRKMMAQDVSEASSRMPMTIWTGILASTTSLMMDSCSPIQKGSSGVRQKVRQPLRPQGPCVDTRDAHTRLHQQTFLGRFHLRRAAKDPLREADSGRAFNSRLTGRDQLIVEFGRASVLDVQTHHCKQNSGILRQLQLREP